MAHVSRPGAERLVTTLRVIFQNRLRSVVAYGAHVDGDGDSRLSSLAIVSSLTTADLEACARHVNGALEDRSANEDDIGAAAALARLEAGLESVDSFAGHFACLLPALAPSLSLAPRSRR